MSDDDVKDDLMVPVELFEMVDEFSRQTYRTWTEEDKLKYPTVFENLKNFRGYAEAVRANAICRPSDVFIPKAHWTTFAVACKRLEELGVLPTANNVVGIIIVKKEKGEDNGDNSK